MLKRDYILKNYIITEIPTYENTQTIYKYQKQNHSQCKIKVPDKVAAAKLFNKPDND